MDAKDIAFLLTEQVQSMLVERLRNFSNEARIVIEAIGKKEGIKLSGHDRLWIILKSLRDVPREMTLDLIRNSSLNDDDKALLNAVFGNPRVNVFSPTKTTKEEVFGDELPGNKILVPSELNEWPRKDVAVTDED